MDMPAIPVDEFAYRGLEKIKEPDELCHVLEKVIKSLPETVMKDRFLEELEIAWFRERG